MRPSWIIKQSPGCNDKCPYMTEEEERDRRKIHVNTGTGEACPKSGCLESAEARPF